MNQKSIIFLGILFSVFSSQFYTPSIVWASNEDNEQGSHSSRKKSYTPVISRYFRSPPKTRDLPSSSASVSQSGKSENIIGSLVGRAPKKSRVDNDNTAGEEHSSENYNTNSLPSSSTSQSPTGNKVNATSPSTSGLKTYSPNDAQTKGKKKRLIDESEEEEIDLAEQQDNSTSLNCGISASSSSCSSTSQSPTGNKGNSASSPTTSNKKPRLNSKKTKGKQKKISSQSEGEEEEDSSPRQLADSSPVEVLPDTSFCLNDIHFALVKDTVTDIKNVLNEKARELLAVKAPNPERLIRRNVRIGAQNAAIFMEFKKLARPSWAQVFTSYLEEQEQGIHIIQDALQEYSGLIFLNVAEKIFVGIFGPGGRHLVNNQMLEPDFGKRAALNNIDPSDLKAVRKIGVLLPLFNPRFVETMFLQGTSINNLGSSGSAPRLLRSVRGKGQSLAGKEKEKHISSGGSCAIWHNLTPIEKFPEVCEELLSLSQRDDYIDNFSWVDDLKPITDKGHINELENDLIEELHTLPLDKWSLLSPYPEESPAMYYRINNAKTKYSSLEEVQQSLAERIKQEINLRRTMVRPFDSRDEALRAWNAYKGLLYEEATKDGTYILVGGTWYLVDVGCINSLDRDINKLFLTNPHPLLDRLTALTPGEAAKGTRDNPNKREQKYNIRMAEQNPEHFLLMDARNASLEKGNSKDVVEVCDLLSPERYLIHIKNWTGSGTFSHLLNQGLSSANMLLDPSYRRKAQHQFMRAEILEYLHNYFEDPSHKEVFASKLKAVFDNSETSEEELSASINLIEEYFGQESMDREKIEELTDLFTQKKIQFERGLPPINFNPLNHTIVYAFFHKDNNETLSEYLPIFSRLALREISHCLRNLGYTNILVKKIDYPASESQKGKGRKAKTAPKKSASSSSSTSQASSSSSSARSQV